MGTTQKIITTGLWGLMVLGMVAIVATRSARRAASPAATSGPESDGLVVTGVQKPAAKFEPLFPAPTFELTDQDGKPFRSESLRGSVHIADFIFTHCGGPCPIMTRKLSEVQALLNHPDVKLVTFTVDPKRDTPEVLRAYGRDLASADFTRWTFLTGTEQQMRDAAIGYKIATQPDADDSVAHSTHFLLVGREGNVCGIYRSSDDDVVSRLAADAMELARMPAPGAAATKESAR
jgi:cytochrome oxidase Cu insertion factor (SCO1/SenC/PrrC family)